MRTLAATLTLCALSAGFAIAQEAPAPLPDVTIAPRSSSTVSDHIVETAKEPAISLEEKLRLIRSRIKYVFVLFQENRSFDFYFGSYPGADGIYAGPEGPYPSGQVPGYTQLIVYTDGTLGTISPFRIPATIKDATGKIIPIYPADIASVNHSHVAIARKIALDSNGVAQNSEYALTEEGVTLKDGVPSKSPSLEREQFGELVMAHVDCDTAPFLWRYADRFTLFDHFMDTIIGPSTPNAIAMISGQSGETQWMLHPEASASGGQGNGAVVPMTSDPQPYWGSPLDTAGRSHQPQATQPFGGVSKNLTFASLPLSFMGDTIKQTTAADYDPAFDLPDVADDIDKIAGHRRSRPSTGAGFSRATITKSTMPPGRPRTRATSPTTTPRSISATSPTTPRPAPTCMGSPNSSRPSRKGSYPPPASSTSAAVTATSATGSPRTPTTS